MAWRPWRCWPWGLFFLAAAPPGWGVTTVASEPGGVYIPAHGRPAEVLKSMTVKALRDLARKQLGAGYTKLKTKSQLVTALAKGIDAAVAKGLLAKLGGKVASAKAAVKAKPATPVAKAKAAPAKKAVATKVPAAAQAKTQAATPTKAPTAKPAPTQAKKSKAKAQPATFYDEQLGELPDRYEDDAFIALPVIPPLCFCTGTSTPRPPPAPPAACPRRTRC